MTIQERKQVIETIMQQKINSLNQIENAKNQLTTEIIELRGKINLLDELLREELKEELPKA